MDLGVSSLQLDERERGFCYSADAPLDMRMDATTGQTAADVLNTYDERELARILRVYGEERFAPRIARAIVAQRAMRPLTRTGELVEHRACQHPGGHAQDRRQPGQAHVPGPADRGERRDRGAGARAAAVDRGARRRRADRRRVVPLARGPGRQACARRRAPPRAPRRTCRSSPPRTHRSCGWSPGARRRPTRPSSRTTPDRSPSVSAPPSASVPPRPHDATSDRKEGSMSAQSAARATAYPAPSRTRPATDRTGTASSRRPRAGARRTRVPVHPCLHGRPRWCAAVRAAAQHLDGGERVRQVRPVQRAGSAATRTSSDLTAELDAKASPAQLADGRDAPSAWCPPTARAGCGSSDGSVQGAPEPAGAGG